MKKNKSIIEHGVINTNTRDVVETAIESSKIDINISWEEIIIKNKRILRWADVVKKKNRKK